MADLLANILQVKIREITKLTNNEFAKSADIKKKDLDKVLRSEVVTAWTYEKIAKALGVHVTELYSWGDLVKRENIQPPTRKIVKADFKNKKPKSPLKAKGRFCIRCWFRDKIYVYDHIELCHYTGIRQHSFNKGRGQKGSHILQCPLCKACHKRFDEPKVRKSVELSEEFLFFISLFIAQEYEEGNIIIKKSDSGV